MNVLWTKPHVLFLGEIHLQPGEPGNQVTAAQLARLREYKMFRDLETLNQIVVREDKAEAKPAIIAQVVDTGDADKAIEKEVAEKAATETKAPASKAKG